MSSVKNIVDSLLQESSKWRKDKYDDFHTRDISTEQAKKLVHEFDLMPGNTDQDSIQGIVDNDQVDGSFEDGDGKLDLMYNGNNSWSLLVKDRETMSDYDDVLDH